MTWGRTEIVSVWYLSCSHLSCPWGCRKGISVCWMRLIYKKREKENFARKKKGGECEKVDFQNLGPRGELLGRHGGKKGSEQLWSITKTCRSHLLSPSYRDYSEELFWSQYFLTRLCSLMYTVPKQSHLSPVKCCFPVIYLTFNASLQNKILCF